MSLQSMTQAHHMIVKSSIMTLQTQGAEWVANVFLSFTVGHVESKYGAVVNKAAAISL